MEVRDLAFDQQGFLWVATSNGIFRFLGSSFDHYGPEQGLLERDIEQVYVDSAGRVWAASFRNIYQWTRDHFTALSPTPLQITPGHHMLALSLNTMLVIADENLLALELDADGKLLSAKPFFSGTQRRKDPNLDAVTALAMGRDGTLWLGCGQAICSFGNDGLHTWGPERGVAARTWLSLLVDHRGAVWAASKTTVLQRTAGAAAFYDCSPPNIDGKRVFYWAPIVEDRAGRVLVDSRDGLARRVDNAWELIGPGNGLKSSRVNSLAIDANGDPWMGTISSDLLHWNGYEQWSGWTETQGLPSSSIWSISPVNRDQVLIGTINGPALLNLADRPPDNKITSLAGIHPWSHGQVGGMAQGSAGQVWAGTFAGSVLRINLPTAQKPLRITPVAELASFIHRLFRSADGRVWIITDSGIDVIDPPSQPQTDADKEKIRHLTDPEKLVSGDLKVVSMASAPSMSNTWQNVPSSGTNLWFLARGAILHYSGNTWTRPTILGLDLASIALKEITCAADGSLWAAGVDEKQRAGVWHLQLHGTVLLASRLELPPALRELLPLAVLVDRRNWLWLGTENGLAVSNGSTWHFFDQQNGMLSDDPDRGVLSEASDGSLWIGTAEGALHLLHPEAAFAPTPLVVTVLSMQRGSDTFLPGSVVALPWSREPVRIRFASPGTWDRNSLVFGYRIEGMNPAWITTTGLEGDFSNLPPGRHRFQVLVRNTETGKSSAMAEMIFEIQPPWWRSPWAVCLYAFATACIFWLMLWLRTRQLLANRLKLERLVQLRTRELEYSREELRMLATHDALTGLLNRAAVLSRLDQEMDRARRDGSLLTVLMADVDYFKKVNDTYGHPAGDAVLRRFADRLSNSIRPYDYVGRYGGEEFLILLTDLEQDKVDERLAGLHHAVSNLKVRFEQHELVVTCSIGVSFLVPGDRQTTCNELLSSADRALYAAKHGGRNRVVCAGRETGEAATPAAQHSDA